MKSLIQSISDVGADLFIGIDSGSDLKSIPGVVVGRALGRTFCTENKVVVLVTFQGLLSALTQLSIAGNLARKNYYLLVIYSSESEASSHLKSRSIMFGMGFNVFKYTSSYTLVDVKRSLSDTLVKINGPVCIFIEESSLNG